MVKAKIKSIDPEVIVATGERYLNVAVELTDTDLKTPILRYFGFAIDTSKETILEEVKKFAELHQLEKVQREENKEVAAQNAHVAELQDLEGEEVAAPEVDPKSLPKGAKTNGRSTNKTKKGGK